MVLYQQFYQPRKAVQQAPFPFHLLYLLLGELELAQGQTKAARKALEKGLRWDPTSAPVRFCYLSVLREEKDWDGFGRVNRDAFRQAFRPATWPGATGTKGNGCSTRATGRVPGTPSC